MSIKGGADDDTIFANNNSLNFFQYDLGDGNDTIIGTTNIVNAYGTNLNAYDTLEISSTKSYDTFIAKAGSQITGNTYIATVIGSDLIFNFDTGTVNFKDIGNAGVNVIDSKDFTVSVFKTAKGEGVYFLNDYAGTIIHGLKGNDTIKDVYDTSKSGKTDSIQVYTFDGDDVIQNENSHYATLDAGAGDDTIENSCKEVKIYTGDGNNRVKNSGNEASIVGGAGSDTISNDMMMVTIRGGAGNDNIVNQGSLLRESTTKKSLLDGGDGDDYIANFYIVVPTDPTLPADNTTILGGAGNDTIFNDGNFNTIEGGKGDDLITLDENAQGNTIIHTPGDGNDTIYGLENNYHLIYDNSRTKKTYGIDGSIILIDNVTDTTPADTTPLNVTNEAASTLIVGTNFADTIENRARNVTISGGKGADSIVNLHVQQVDSNGNIVSTTYDGNNVSIDGGDDNDYIDNYGATGTINGGAGNDHIYNMGKIVINGNDDSIVKVSGKFLLEGDDGNDYLSNQNNGAKILGGAGNDSIINSGNNVSIDLGDGNDQIENWSADNVTITSGKGDDVIINVDNSSNSNYGANLLLNYAAGDGNDEIYGFNATSTLSITGATYTSVKSGDNLVFMVGESKITLVDATSLSSVNVYGTAKTSTILTVNNRTASPVKAGSTTLVINASKRTKSVKILGNKLNNTISGGTGNDSIFGGAGNDSIFGSKGKDTLLGEADNDKIFGGTGNDSISGGSGKDTLSGDAGNDKIFGGKDNDSISGGDGKDTLSGDAGNDKIFGGKDNDSISGGDGKDTLSGDAGNDKIFGGKDNDSISGGDGKDTLSGDAGNDKIFGGACNDSINGGDGKDTLSGDAGNDKLFGGKGNDSLWGGAGNDTLYGGDGKDTFIYMPGEGTDHIIDYTNGDLLKILKSNGKTGGSFTSSSFKNGNLTLSISGGGKVIFDDVSKNSTFNINSMTYRISGKKLVEKF